MSKNIILVGAEGGIGNSIISALNEVDIFPLALDKKSGFDITKSEQLNYIYEKIERVDGIVMAHGITRSNWDTTIDVNLSSVYRFLNLMHHRMTKYGGSIVNVTSLGAHMGFPDNPQYCASKGGLRSLTKSLACDWGKYNIRVNNVVPGYIKTGMTSKSYNNKLLKAERDKRMILNRWGNPEDIANAVVFLLSNKSSYITGIDLVVDGGWMAKGL